MLPTSGPTQVVKTSGTTPTTWCSIKQKYGQAKPYNLLLPYRCLHFSAKRLGGLGTHPDSQAYGGGQNTPLTFDTTGDSYFTTYQAIENQAISLAIKAFNSKQGEVASLGIATAQSREALKMMTKRVTQVLQLAVAVKKLRLGEACDILGLTVPLAKTRRRKFLSKQKGGSYYPPPKGTIWDTEKRTTRHRAKQFADNWLEFSFGWAPLVDDIEKARKVLSDGVPFYTHPFKAGGRRLYNYTLTETSSDAFQTTTRTGRHAVNFRVSVGGVLTVTNSNYKLWSMLGFTNLPLLVYEAVPFSFIANYFFNIEEWLQQYSQYDGVTVSQAWYTIVWDDTINFTDISQRTVAPLTTTVNYDYEMRAASIKRIVGSLPTVKLGARSAYHNGVKRALNNVSLLVGLFIKR